MPLNAFRQRFSFKAWFDKWREELEHPATTAAEGRWSLAPRRAVLEALSDAGAEQFLNPLIAGHLRRFGGQLAQAHAPERWFWVRSEWEKVDISYGLATHFSGDSGGWNRAWDAGKTGDMGQCEVKVCYVHHCAGQIMALAAQLKQRRDRDVRRKAPGRDALQYHGVVWLFQHDGAEKMGAIGKGLEEEARSLGLDISRAFKQPAKPDALGRLWPSLDGREYTCGLSIALVKL